MPIWFLCRSCSYVGCSYIGCSYIGYSYISCSYIRCSNRGRALYFFTPFPNFEWYVRSIVCSTSTSVHIQVHLLLDRSRLVYASFISSPLLFSLTFFSLFLASSLPFSRPLSISPPHILHHLPFMASLIRPTFSTFVQV